MRSPWSSSSLLSDNLVNVCRQLRGFCNHHTQGTASSPTELPIGAHHRLHSDAAPSFIGYGFALDPMDRVPDRRQGISCRCPEDFEQPTVPHPFHYCHKQLQTRVKGSFLRLFTAGHCDHHRRFRLASHIFKALWNTVPNKSGSIDRLIDWFGRREIQRAERWAWTRRTLPSTECMSWSVKSCWGACWRAPYGRGCRVHYNIVDIGAATALGDRKQW